MKDPGSMASGIFFQKICNKKASFMTGRVKGPVQTEHGHEYEGHQLYWKEKAE